MGGATDPDISHAIQLAIAPVFLLTGVGTILNVLSTRLGRVVDRTRVLIDLRESADPPHRKKMDDELHLLVRRRHLVNNAITAGTTSALLVSVLIAVTFVGGLLGVHMAPIIAGLFVLAMVAFVVALLLFLREVIAATTHVDFT
jgi:hypothetical protein